MFEASSRAWYATSILPPYFVVWYCPVPEVHFSIWKLVIEKRSIVWGEVSFRMNRGSFWIRVTNFVFRRERSISLSFWMASAVASTRIRFPFRLTVGGRSRLIVADFFWISPKPCGFAVKGKQSNRTDRNFRA